MNLPSPPPGCTVEARDGDEHQPRVPKQDLNEYVPRSHEWAQRVCWKTFLAKVPGFGRSASFRSSMLCFTFRGAGLGVSLNAQGVESLNGIARVCIVSCPTSPSGKPGSIPQDLPRLCNAQWSFHWISIQTALHIPFTGWLAKYKLPKLAISESLLRPPLLRLHYVAINWLL